MTGPPERKRSRVRFGTKAYAKSESLRILYIPSLIHSRYGKLSSYWLTPWAGKFSRRSMEPLSPGEQALPRHDQQPRHEKAALQQQDGSSHRREQNVERPREGRR